MRNHCPSTCNLRAWVHSAIFARARTEQIDPTRPGTYHIISRCVRRAFLCGNDAEHHREWLETGLRTHAQAFAVDVLNFAIMANHLHVVVRTDPDLAQAWSAHEVTRRWGIIFPKVDPESRRARRVETSRGRPWRQ